MNLFELIKDLLIGLSIAILLPVTVYWSVNLFYKYPEYNEHVKYESSKELKKEELKAWQEAKKPYEHAMFLGSLIVGIIALVIGTLISIYSLSIGLILGGIFNLIIASIYSPHIPLINFLIYLFLLIILIFIAIKKK